MFVPLDNDRGTVVFFFSRLNFGDTFVPFINDELQESRLSVLGNLKHILTQRHDMAEYDLINFKPKESEMGNIFRIHK